MKHRRLFRGERARALPAPCAPVNEPAAPAPVRGTPPLRWTAIIDGPFAETKEHGFAPRTEDVGIGRARTS